ncbi:MAG: hypothetical protein ACOC15_00845 [Desulfovibrionales bacterium]
MKEDVYMESLKVKDLMIPVSEYVRVSAGDTLLDCFVALERDREEKGRTGRAHKDALVFDTSGAYQGNVTMVDVFMALEPTYKRIVDSSVRHQTLTGGYVSKLFKDYELWSEPFKDLCSRSAGLKVEEVMHRPGEEEYIDEDSSLDKALHKYVVGVRQPLIVRKGKEVTGVLRVGDMFEEIRKQILACSLK